MIEFISNNWGWILLVGVVLAAGEVVLATRVCSMNTRVEEEEARYQARKRRQGSLPMAGETVIDFDDPDLQKKVRQGIRRRRW